MQIRRVLLLFALVLGLSALVATIAPPPETDDEATDDATIAEPAPRAPSAAPPFEITVGERPVTHRVRVGSSFSLEVSVPKPGDVVLEGLGYRQSVDALTPARFTILAEPAGRYGVGFVPVDGERRTAGRLVFAEPATVTPRRRDR